MIDKILAKIIAILIIIILFNWAISFIKKDEYRVKFTCDNREGVFYITRDTEFNCE